MNNSKTELTEKIIMWQNSFYGVQNINKQYLNSYKLIMAKTSYSHVKNL